MTKPGFDFRELDELIHSRPRLAIMSILVEASADEIGFNHLRRRLELTDGNLSTHLRRLEDFGYIGVRKEFVDRKPRSNYFTTSQGYKAFQAYLEQLEKLIRKHKSFAEL